MKDKSRVYTYVAVGATLLQMYVPQLKENFHLADVTVKVITAILIAIISIATIKKQRISVEVNRKAVIVTWFLISIAAIGCLNEILSFAYLDYAWANTLRSIVASALGFFNLVSKSLFPTEAGKVIQTIKSDLKQGTFGTENTVDVPLKQ